MLQLSSFGSNALKSAKVKLKHTAIFYIFGIENTGRKITVEPKAQNIPKEELATILRLHRCRIGWSYLLANTIADRDVGFPCEKEEFLIRRELKRTVYKVSEWFKAMQHTHHWSFLRKGYIWQIDFGSGQAVPKKEHSKGNLTAKNIGRRQSSTFTDQFIMTLGDIDLEIISRLLENTRSFV